LEAHKQSPARILVMEDNPADVTLLRVALDHHSDDYRLDVLRDGAEALNFVRQQSEAQQDHAHPCVIVMDMHLPKHDGPAVLEALSQSPLMEHMRVVVLTSVTAPQDEEALRRLGIRLYRAKPIHVDDWISLAGEILDICHDRVVA